LAGAGIDAAEDFILTRKPRDAIFERADEFHPVIKLQLVFHARRGGFSCARRWLSFCASISIRHRRTPGSRLKMADAFKTTAFRATVSTRVCAGVHGY